MLGWLVLIVLVVSTILSRLPAKPTEQGDIVEDVEELIVDTLSG